jgi:hypothetical protein
VQRRPATIITTAAGAVWFAIRVRIHLLSVMAILERLNLRRHTTHHGLASRICTGDQDHVPDVFIKDFIYRAIAHINHTIKRSYAQSVTDIALLLLCRNYSAIFMCYRIARHGDGMSIACRKQVTCIFVTRNSSSLVEHITQSCLIKQARRQPGSNATWPFTPNHLLQDTMTSAPLRGQDALV